MHGRAQPESNVPPPRQGPSPGGGRRAVGEAGVGRALRRARLARQLTVADIETALRIRARHVAALESGHLDELPGDAYARLFLRQYAEYLGLDGDEALHRIERRVDEAAGSPPHGEPRVADGALAQPEAAPALLVWADRALAQVPPGTRRWAWLVVAAGFLVGLALWNAGGPRDTGGASPTPASAARAPAPAGPPRHDGRLLSASLALAAGRSASVSAASARLDLAASRGDCWVLVRDGGPSGPARFEGTLHAGASIAFTGRALWLRIGAPWNLDVRLGGRLVRDLPRTPGNLLVTPRGAHVA